MRDNYHTTSPDFFMMIQTILNDFRKKSEIVSTERWQGVETNGRLDYMSKELLNYHVCVPLKSESLEYYRKELTPNLPWADGHFEERVCGQPINPGTEWANWPWAGSAAKHRKANEKFNHNYMERFWPKFAGHPMDQGFEVTMRQHPPHKGIYHTYGDLKDVVDYLVKEPHTRQAYLPIFFPEDTGFGDGGRKPCTLGYQFIMRDNVIHIYYPLRSCDFYKHFRDDVYLAIRLLMWVRDQCAKQDSKWVDVKLGTITMHMTSFHLFYNDFVKLFGKDQW